MTPIKTDYFPLNIFVEYINFNRLKIESSCRERLGEAARAESNEWWNVGPSLSRCFCWLKHSCEDHVQYQMRDHCGNNWIYGLVIMPIHVLLFGLVSVVFSLTCWPMRTKRPLYCTCIHNSVLVCGLTLTDQSSHGAFLVPIQTNTVNKYYV